MEQQFDRSTIYRSETVVFIAGHMTPFQPMRIQRFCWWDNNSFYLFCFEAHYHIITC